MPGITRGMTAERIVVNRDQATHDDTLEQVRGDRGAQARQAGTRNPAKEHDRRHPFARRDPAGRGLRQAASRHGAHPALPFRQCRDPRAESKAGRGHPLAHHELRRPPHRSRRHGHRRSARHAAAEPVLLHGSARCLGEGLADGQRRACRICRRQARPLRGARHRAADGRRGGREGARALYDLAQDEGRGDSHQCRRARAVGARLRAVLEEGRGARRAGVDSPRMVSPRPSVSPASISTTSSATRSKPRSRCTT